MLLAHLHCNNDLAARIATWTTGRLALMDLALTVSRLRPRLAEVLARIVAIFSQSLLCSTILVVCKQGAEAANERGPEPLVRLFYCTT